MVGKLGLAFVVLRAVGVGLFSDSRGIEPCIFILAVIGRINFFGVENICFMVLYYGVLVVGIIRAVYLSGAEVHIFTLYLLF